MILLPTLWKTVKWKHVLFWYTVISLAFWFGYDPANGPIAIVIAGQMAMTIFSVFLKMTGKVFISRHYLPAVFPIIPNLIFG